MIKLEIDKLLSNMGLCYDKKDDFWHFPPGIDAPHQFRVRDPLKPYHLDSGAKTMQVRVTGGPVAAQGWYMPEQAVEHIQRIIWDLFEDTFDQLYSCEPHTWYWSNDLKAYEQLQIAQIRTITHGIYNKK